MADPARIMRADHPDAPTTALRTATPVTLGGTVMGYRTGKRTKALTGIRGRAARRQQELAQLNLWRRANGILSEPVGFLITAANAWRMLRGTVEPMASIASRHDIAATDEEIARAEAYPTREDRLLSAEEAGRLLEVTQAELEAILIDANFALTLWAKDEGEVSRAERRAARRRAMSRKRSRKARAKKKLAKCVTQRVTLNQSKVTPPVTPLSNRYMERDAASLSLRDGGASRAILRALAEGHETADAIAEAADQKLTSTKTLLCRMLKRGLATRTARGRYAMTDGGENP